MLSCQTALDQPTTPACTVDYGERITYILLSKTEVTAVGNVPTALEFGTADDNGTLATIRVSAHKVPLGETEIEVIYKENHDKQYRVDGKILLLSEAIARMCEKLDRYEALYAYYFTDKDYCFGPYYAAPSFNLRKIEGQKPIYIDFKLDFYPGIDYANHDSSYPTFAAGYVILTAEDGDWLTTEDGTVIIL